MNFNEKYSTQMLTMENLSEIYHKKLDEILYIELTVENINTFAPTAEKQLLKLNDEILEQYATNSLFDGDKSLSIKGQEDDAYQKLGLPNLQDILKLIIDKIDQLHGLKIFIKKQTRPIERVITPPQPNIISLIPGNEPYVEKQKLPRLLSLIYILSNDLDIPLENISITEGRLRPEMMRKTPYSRIIAQSLNRLIYICDEEENASYIFDTKMLAEHKIDIDKLDIDDKAEKNDLILRYPGIGVRLIQRKVWRELIKQALTQPIPANYDQDKSEQKIKRRKKSEFIKFLDYTEFQAEVQKVYEEQGSPSSIRRWYEKEYKNHPTWPSNPNATYANKGWQSMEELIGKEKRTLLPFAEFQTEVQKFYREQGSPLNVSRWYKSIYKTRPNWPSNPNDIYKDKGWESWEVLVGKEKFNFLSFAKFQQDVQKYYQEQGSPSNIGDWYDKEYKNHLNWPSNPNHTYAQKGWKNWNELVKKEKTTFLPFIEFQAEVQKSYQEQNSPSNILEWYFSEYKKHPKWPSAPYSEYSRKGWKDWKELVGKEKKIFLTYSEFQSEVQKLYREQGSPSGSAAWYKTEYKNHLNWPSEPYATYANKGWKNWDALVGKEKKIFLTYSELQAEVQKLYRKQSSPSNIYKWYRIEYNHHPSWPSAPDRSFASNGWKSWEELVGKVKKTFLLYSELKEEVRKLYKEQGSPPGSIEWYMTERKNHPNWPREPFIIYANKGWENWSELVGKENQKFLTYSELRAEVQKSYLEQGRPANIAKWYRTEYINHYHWPSNPHRIYSKEGWKNWINLVSN